MVAYKKPRKQKLFVMSRMQLLAQLKLAHDEIDRLKLTVRARNITNRELRMTKRKHWEKIKELRVQLEEIK